MRSTLDFKIIDVSELVGPSKGFLVSSTAQADNIQEQFVYLRTSNNQSTIFDGTMSIAEATVFLGIALSLDYSSTGQYTFSVIGVDTIRFTAINENVVFSVISNTAFLGVEITINNIAVTPSIKIDDVSFSPAVINDICTHVQVDVATNVLATEILSPPLGSNIDNPFDFESARGVILEIEVEDVSLNTDSVKVQIPKELATDNITVNVIQAPTGATATVDVIDVDGLTLEYSLDDITYQSENVFSGLAIANYTAYVRDQFGCTKSKPFEVDGLTPNLDVTEPFELVSIENSFRFAKRITSTACGNYQNSETRLSCEENVNDEVKYKTIQRYNSCDIIETQFKSNYDNLTAVVVRENGTEDALILNKITDNLEREDSRDAKIFSLGNNQTGIYYTSGATYDYVTNFPIGTYALNGNLPEYALIGNYVEIVGTGIVQIVDIITDVTVNAKVLVFNFVYAGVPSDTVVVKTQYSIANFEAYEFDTDMSTYNDEDIRVRINMTHPDPAFEDIEYLSEIIRVRTEHTSQAPNEMLEIVYYNTDNGEIIYLNDDGEVRIKHKIRQEIEIKTIDGDSNSEIQNTDTTTILLNASIYRGDEFEFIPVPTEMARKIQNSLTHNVVLINGEGYVAEEIPEIERLGSSNLYTVTAKMIKTGKIYNTAIQGIGNEVPETQEIPALIEGETGFIQGN
jgi:hypothetical protein